MFIPAFMLNAMTSDFLSQIFPGWVVMFLDSHLMVFTFLSYLDLLGVALAFRISILNIFKLLPNFWHTVTDITSFEKHSEKSLGQTLTFYLIWWNIVSRICFGRNLSPVFYGDLVYKLNRVKCKANVVSSGSKIVKRLARWKYDPEIIEKTIGLVLGPSTALYRSIRKHCTLTNKAVGYMTGLVQTSSEATRSWSPSPLVVSRDSLSLLTWARVQTARSTAYFDGCP